MKPGARVLTIHRPAATRLFAALLFRADAPGQVAVFATDGLAPVRLALFYVQR